MQLSFSVTNLKLVKDRHTYLSFVYSAKSLAKAIRIRKEKVTPVRKVKLFEVTGCQHKKIILHKTIENKIRQEKSKPL